MSDPAPAVESSPAPAAETPAVATEAPVQTTPQAEEAVAESQRSADALESSTPSLEDAMSSINLDNLSNEQVADLSSGDPAKVAAALGMKGESKPAPKVAPAPATDEPTAQKAVDRISIKALPPEDRSRALAAMDAVRAGKDPKQAFAEAFGITGESAPSQSEDAPETPQSAPIEVAPPPEVAEIQSKIDALVAKRDQARAEFSPTAEEDSDAIMELRIDLRDAKRQAEQSQRESATLEAQVNESHSRAFEKYADLATDPDSGFQDYADVEIILAERKNDPILTRPDWPEHIADRVFAKHYKSKAANSSPDKNGNAPSSIPPAPKNDVRFSGSPIGPNSSAGAMTPLVAEAEMSKLDQDQQDAVMAQLERLANKR